MEDESEPHLTREPSTSKGGSDMYSESWYKRRRLPSCNQAIMLRDRELGRSKRGGTSYRSYRDFYTTLPLNRYLEVPEFLGPRDHILGWTPDGLRLICLSFHLDAVRIYEYLGAQESKSARDEMVLSEMFRLQREIKTRQADLQFRFDCVLFTDDAKHMIIPASVAVADSNINMERLFRTNESLPLQGNHIEDYHFYCIDVAKGTVVGQLEFDQDRILLPHGVCISRRYLLITSYQHQVMHLIYINPQTGALELLREIGPSVRDDDPLHLPVSLTSHLRTSFLSGLKQILMTFLFKRAKEGGRERVKEYLRSCEYYTSLRIDKVVIFEEFFLLIRMLPREIGRETSALPCFFAIIDWREATVLEVYTAFDEKFYNCVSELAESLLFPITTDAWVGSDLFPIHARMTLSKGKKRGEQKHTSESLRRLLNQMPFPSYQPYKISAQSPYLDPHLFYLEDKTAAGILNGKTRLDIEDPRFMSSRSGRIAFQLPLSLVGGSTLRQVTLLFHPRDPLCLAVDRLRSDNCVIVFLPKSEDSEPPSDDAPPTESPPDRPDDLMRSAVPLREMHLALVGMTGSGKSALAVKYITKRFIGDYDSLLEDTYCRADTVGGQSLMVWVMDTVDDATRDEMRWLAWADVYVVVYDVTSQLSLQYADSLLERIDRHEHLLCARDHKTILLGNKSDLERYRQVSESEGEAMAKKHKASFAEVSATADHRVLMQILHSCFHNILNGTRSPSPRLCSSDSEIVTPRKTSGFSLRSSSRSSQMRAKPPPTKPTALHKTPSLSKIKTGSKLLKLFHN